MIIQRQFRLTWRTWRTLLTTTTTALFLVVGITGVMLLLGLAKGTVKGVHEWLGLAFTFVAVAHGLYHWRAIVTYARGAILWIATGAVLAATLAFVIPSGTASGPNPMRATIEMVRQAPLDRLAALMSVDASELETRLRSRGVEFDSTGQSLADIERASGRHMPELLAIVTRK